MIMPWIISNMAAMPSSWQDQDMAAMFFQPGSFWLHKIHYKLTLNIQNSAEHIWHNVLHVKCSDMYYLTCTCIQYLDVKEWLWWRTSNFQFRSQQCVAVICRPQHSLIGQIEVSVHLFLTGGSFLLILPTVESQNLTPPPHAELVSDWLKFTLGWVKTIRRLLFRTSNMVWGGGGGS